ncbi:toxin-antitoxin system YwqK family antitoxin [Fibrobacterota bacterium]
MKAISGIVLICVIFLCSCEKIKEKETYYPNKQLKERWNVTLDAGKEIKNGLYESWHDNGKRKYVSHYLDDQKHGVHKEFYKDGTKKRREIYHFGSLMGKQKRWDKEGNIVSEAVYKDGKKNGKYLQYYKGGKIHKKINFLDDKKFGVQIEYKEDGNLVNASWYKEGKPVAAPADSAAVVEAAVKEDTASVEISKGEQDEEEEEVAVE